MIRNSLGNLTEIIQSLDSDTKSGEQIAENYSKLADKWGEWVVFNGAGAMVKFVDIRAAFFSGLARSFMVLSFVFVVLAVAIGGILLPQLAKMYKAQNEYMVDLATLKTQQDVKNIRSGL